MSGRAPLVLTGSLALGVVIMGALIWKAYAPGGGAPAAEAAVAPEAEPADDEPTMDLDLLSDADLAFLEQTLLQGRPEAARSAAKALLLAERLEGAPMLFEAAARGGADALTFCLAGLEILRLQRADAALRELLLALRRGGNLPEGCRVELADRFGLVSRGQLGAVLSLGADADPEVRAWVAETASQREGPGVDAVLQRLATDAEPLVRRSVWLGVQGRPLAALGEGFGQAAAAEADPRNVELLQALGLR